MKQRYLDYALYNIWANDRLINNLLEQDDALLSHELVGSFSTIRKTIIHIWFAETGWLSRLKGKGWETTKVTSFLDTNEALFKSWQNTSEEFKDFVDKSELEKEIQFENSGEMFSIPAREIIQTVFNHGSYHRGQVVMMMRQLGVSKIAQTDYIEWVREKSKNRL